MILGLNEIAQLSPADRPVEFCVIGTGPAGLTVARALARAGREVLLLEAGGEEPTEASQDMYRGESLGDPYHDLERTRQRSFGGTSGIWGGICRPLDAADLGPKPEFALASWPIGISDLDPWHAEAAEILELPPVPDDRTVGPSTGVRRIYFGRSPPVRFRDKYFETVRSSDLIRLCLNANVTRIVPQGGRVSHLEVAGYDGERLDVRARNFVIACGGIENSRLLLWSNEAAGGALLPPVSPVGGYWMEHPHFTIGEAIMTGLAGEIEFYDLDAATRRHLGVLGCGLRVLPVDTGALPTAQRIVNDLACIAPGFGRWALDKLGGRPFCGAVLRAAWEQEPRPESRIALSRTARDSLGVPRPELHWRKSARDLRTLRETAIQFGRYLIEEDRGRVRLDDWVLGDGDYPPDDELGGYHHMGGTRMSDSPGTGVVDSDCRVFGMENLHVAGSSVFPSGGHANPTLTIVQLALRLAGHLLAKA